MRHKLKKGKSHKRKHGRSAQIDTPVQRKYLTRRESAKYLGCSYSHFITLVHAGKVIEYDFGPYLKRYTIADLDKYAEAHRKGAQ